MDPHSQGWKGNFLCGADLNSDSVETMSPKSRVGLCLPPPPHPLQSHRGGGRRDLGRNPGHSGTSRPRSSSSWHTASRPAPRLGTGLWGRPGRRVSTEGPRGSAPCPACATGLPSPGTETRGTSSVTDSPGCHPSLRRSGLTGLRTGHGVFGPAGPRPRPSSSGDSRGTRGGWVPGVFWSSRRLHLVCLWSQG